MNTKFEVTYLVTYPVLVSVTKDSQTDEETLREEVLREADSILETVSISPNIETSIHYDTLSRTQLLQLAGNLQRAKNCGFAEAEFLGFLVPVGDLREVQKHIKTETGGMPKTDKDYVFVSDSFEYHDEDKVIPMNIYHSKKLDLFIGFTSDNKEYHFKLTKKPHELDECERVDILDSVYGVGNYVWDETVEDYDILLHNKFVKRIK